MFQILIPFCLLLFLFITFVSNTFVCLMFTEFDGRMFLVMYSWFNYAFSELIPNTSR